MSVSRKVFEAAVRATAAIEQSQLQEARNVLAAAGNPPLPPTPVEFTQFQESICPVCKKRGVPVWFRVRPESAQAMSGEKKKTFRDNIRSKILERYTRISDERGISRAWNVTNDGDQLRVCVHLLFGLAKVDNDKDVDNMAKAFLDAIKDDDSESYGLISDDSFVQHLSIQKYTLLLPPAGQAQDLNYIVGVKIATLRSNGIITYQLAPPDSFEL